MLVGLSPQDSIRTVMKTLKGVSARLLNKEREEILEKELWNGYLWSPSYYIATTNDNVIDNIKKYIKEQGNN